MKRHTRFRSFIVVLGMFMTNEACERDGAQINTQDAANATARTPMMNNSKDAGSTYGGNNGNPGLGTGNPWAPSTGSTETGSGGVR